MENQGLLIIADYFFLVFHTSLIVFNLFGWIWPPLRKWHFACISLTFASWFILGIWYGWGYCFLTDWHWEVLRKLGKTNLPSSYISYLLDRVLGIQLQDTVVDILTVGLGLIALGISIKVNFFNRKN